MEADNRDKRLSLTVREAGRRGGLKTLREYGLAHYRSAGKRGAATLLLRYSRDQLAAWGKKGGRPRKPKLSDMGDRRDQPHERKVSGSRPLIPPPSPHSTTDTGDRSVKERR